MTHMIHCGEQRRGVTSVAFQQAAKYVKVSGNENNFEVERLSLFFSAPTLGGMRKCRFHLMLFIIIDEQSSFPLSVCFCLCKFSNELALQFTKQ